MPPPTLSRLVLLGASGHGKTRLGRAILDDAASRGWATPTAVTAQIEMRHAGGRMLLLDPPPGADLTATLFAMPQMEAAVVVVSLASGITAATREQLHVARAAGVRRVVLFFSHGDELEDRELRRWVADEAKAAVADSGLHAEATTCERDDLLDALDRLRWAGRDEQSPFVMSIRETASVRGRGTMVTGVVRRGRIGVGEPVELVGEEAPFRTAATMIEVGRAAVEETRAGDEAAVLLLGADLRLASCAHVLAAPDSLAPRVRLPVELMVLAAEDGGRGTTLPSGEGLWCWIGSAQRAARVLSPREHSPGERARVTLELDDALAVEGGAPVALRAGSTTVAVGAIERDSGDANPPVTFEGRPFPRTRGIRPLSLRPPPSPISAPAPPTPGPAREPPSPPRPYPPLLEALVDPLGDVPRRALADFVAALVTGEPAAELALTDIDRAIARIDAAVDRQLRVVLAHPPLRELRRIWTDLRTFVATGGRGDVAILNLSLQDLRLDVADSPEVEKSGLYKLVCASCYGSYAGEPYAVMSLEGPITDSEDDQRVLAWAARVAHLACTVLVVGQTRPSVQHRALDGAGFVAMRDEAPFSTLLLIQRSFHHHGWGAHAGGRTLTDELSRVLALARFAQTMMVMHRANFAATRTPETLERFFVRWLARYRHLVEARVSVTEVPNSHGWWAFSLVLEPRWDSSAITYEGRVLTE